MRKACRQSVQRGYDVSEKDLTRIHVSLILTLMRKTRQVTPVRETRQGVCQLETDMNTLMRKTRQVFQRRHDANERDQTRSDSLKLTLMRQTRRKCFSVSMTPNRNMYIKFGRKNGVKLFWYLISFTKFYRNFQTNCYLFVIQGRKHCFKQITYWSLLFDTFLYFEKRRGSCLCCM